MTMTKPTIEMTTAVLVYIPVAYLADRSTKKPFVLITFVFFTLFPLALLYSRSLEENERVSSIQ